jgi:hypothetical protein
MIAILFQKVPSDYVILHWTFDVSPYIMAVSFIGGGNWSIQRKPPTCDNFYHIMLYRVDLAMNEVRTHNFSGDRYWLHR